MNSGRSGCQEIVDRIDEIKKIVMMMSIVRRRLYGNRSRACVTTITGYGTLDVASVMCVYVSEVLVMCLSKNKIGNLGIL